MLMTENTKGWYPRTKERPGYEITGEKGDAGEDQVWKYCEEEGLEYEAYYDRYSQVNRKIDGKINGKLVDVKNNGWQFEGEGFWHKIELDKSKKGDGKGWLNTSEAEEIWVVFEGVEQFVKYNVPKMRKYIAKLIEDKPHRYKRLSKKEGNTAYGVNVNFDYVPGRLWDGIDARDKKVREKQLEHLRQIAKSALDEDMGLNDKEYCSLPDPKPSFDTWKALCACENGWSCGEEPISKRMYADIHPCDGINYKDRALDVINELENMNWQSAFSYLRWLHLPEDDVTISVPQMCIKYITDWRTNDSVVELGRYAYVQWKLSGPKRGVQFKNRPTLKQWEHIGLRKQSSVLRVIKEMEEIPLAD